MRTLICFAILASCITAIAQDQKPTPTLKNVLLEQLHSTHDKSDWFVCANTAVEGLSPEQAAWTDGKGNHSVGQLVTHIVYWDRRSLQKFKGEPEDKFS